MFGFISLFGLLALSVWRAVKVSALLKDKNDQRLLLSHALIITVVMIDQLPNDSLHAWLIFLVGALLGRANHIKHEAQRNTRMKYARLKE